MSRYTKISEAMDVIETYPMMKGFVPGEPLPRDRIGKSLENLDDEFNSAVQFLRGYIVHQEDYQSRLVALSLDALATTTRESGGQRFIDQVRTKPRY